MTYIVSSTFSGVSLPCICFMASLAFSIASKVSLLMLADSIAFICCSRVPIWASVCSRLCSWAFFRFSAAFAAVLRDESGLACARSHQTRPRGVWCLSRCRVWAHHYCCLRIRISGPSWSAHPSGSADASRASAACQAESAGRGWRSWAHFSLPGRSRPRTSSGPSQTFCVRDRVYAKVGRLR